MTFRIDSYISNLWCQKRRMSTVYSISIIYLYVNYIDWKYCF